MWSEIEKGAAERNAVKLSVVRQISLSFASDTKMPSLELVKCRYMYILCCGPWMSLRRSADTMKHGMCCTSSSSGSSRCNSGI